MHVVDVKQEKTKFRPNPKVKIKQLASDIGQLNKVTGVFTIAGRK